MFQIPRLCLALLLAAISLLPHAAQANDPDQALSARLLSGWRDASGAHIAAIELDLAPGWHTYWRAPGEAGLPTELDSSGSANLAQSEILWPSPRIYDQNGYRSYGYDGLVVLPLRLTPRKKGRAIEFDAVVDLGVCKDICMPRRLRISASLPADAQKRDPRIIAALADRPYSASEIGAGTVSCTMTPGGKGITLETQVALAPLAGPEAVVIETSNPQLWVGRTQMRREGRRLYAKTQIEHVEGTAFSLRRSDVMLTVIGRGEAVELRGCARPK